MELSINCGHGPALRLHVIYTSYGQALDDCLMTEHESMLNEEHTELLSRISEMSGISGEPGRLFAKILEIFSGHLDREEETVIPLVIYLEERIEGSAQADESLGKYANDFRTEYPTMISEHREMDGMMKQIESISSSDDAAKLIREIRHHVRMEEEILYPAAMAAADMVSLHEDGDIKARK